MFEQPQPPHAWFAPLTGHWKSEGECLPGPDQPPMKSSYPVQVRSLGGMWTVIESTSTEADGSVWTTVMTLGYSVARQRYTGTFVGSMGSHLWVYDGQVSDDGRRIVLNTEGPRFDGQGTARYQDTIEIVDDNHWILSSQVENAEGQWFPFMKSDHFRQS